MNSNLKTFSALLTVVAMALLAQQAHADPLVGRDLLKFSQRPMNNTQIVDTTGVAQTYYGHDELSTAYGFPNSANQIVEYAGKFMADDFADNLSSPVVHVKWWGSYHNDFINPQMPVNRFLVAFESDVPVSPTQGYSTPGNVLQLDVVNRSMSLSPGSGQFTEKLIRGPDPILNESLYEYNAELHLNRAFFEQKDTVYWLKIAALVDVPQNVQPFPGSSPPPFATQWGWHNRDYTIQNTLASPNVATPPFGEFIEGQVAGGTNVWHFQDDSVQGDLRWIRQQGLPNFGVFQANMTPQFYLGGIDGPMANVPGTVGINNFSKDLAFELYTIIPEPGTCVLVLSALTMFVAYRRR